jgi:hypothetical protein
MIAKYIFGNKRQKRSVKHKAKQMMFGKTLVLAVSVASISYVVVSSIQKSRASQLEGTVHDVHPITSDIQGIF